MTPSKGSDATGTNALHAAAPVILAGATFAARKAMVKGYEKGTGHAAPLARSRESSLLEKVLWAAAMAGVIALVEVIVWQFIGDDAS